MKRILSYQSLVAAALGAAVLAAALFVIDKSATTPQPYPYKIIATVRSKPFRHFVVARRVHNPKAKTTIL